MNQHFIHAPSSQCFSRSTYSTQWMIALYTLAPLKEVALYRQRQLRRRRDSERSETYAYAFTEMLVQEFEGENEITKAAEGKDVTFATVNKNSDFQHASTEEGEAFIAFVRLILKQTGLIRLLWGKIFESESNVILLLGESPRLGGLGAAIIVLERENVISGLYWRR